LRCFATSRKVAGLSPNEVNVIYSTYLNLLTSLSPWALLSFQQNTAGEVFSLGKARPALKTDNLAAVRRLYRKCGILDISQPCRSPRPVRGIALFVLYYYYYYYYYYYHYYYNPVPVLPLDYFLCRCYPVIGHWLSART
jgi:hypothetical protein